MEKVSPFSGFDHNADMLLVDDFSDSEATVPLSLDFSSPNFSLFNFTASNLDIFPHTSSDSSLCLPLEAEDDDLFQLANNENFLLDSPAVVELEASQDNLEQRMELECSASVGVTPFACIDSSLAQLQQSFDTSYQQFLCAMESSQASARQFAASNNAFLQQQLSHIADLRRTLDLLEEVQILENEEICQFDSSRLRLQVIDASFQPFVSLVKRLAMDAVNDATIQGFPVSSGSPDISAFVSLVIVEQPGSLVVMKQTKLPSPFRVQLVFAPGVSVTAVSPVHAHPVSAVTHNRKIRVENSSTPMMNHRASFDHLRFIDGSHQNLLRLRFSVEVEARSPLHGLQRFIVTSALSEPLVVMVHQSQWTESERLLVVHACLANDKDNHRRLATTTEKFCNVVRRRLYLLCLTQNAALKNSSFCRTVVPVCKDEITEAVSAQMSQAQLGEENIIEIWKALAAYYASVRDPRRNFRLWRDGVICGFMTDTMAEECLLKFGSPGSAILRFSPTTPGKFIASWYKPTTKAIEHLPLSPTDCRRKLSSAVLKMKSVTSVLYINRSESNRSFGVMSRTDVKELYEYQSRKKR